MEAAPKAVGKYDMPPMHIFRLETSPRMISAWPFVSYQVNVDADGQNIVGDAANECAISVDPTNRARWQLVGGSLACQRPTSASGWDIRPMAAHHGLSGVLKPTFFRSDPVTNSDETGTFFYLSLLQTFCENMPVD